MFARHAIARRTTGRHRDEVRPFSFDPAMKTAEIESLRQQFIESAGHATQMLGFGRIIGQTYMLAFFRREPVSLEDLTRELGISKGSASMTVRQLEAWGALRKVWRKGDRKDYYEARDEFGRIIRKALLEMIGQRLETADRLLVQSDETLNGRNASDDEGDESVRHFRKRVAQLKAFRRKTQGLLESPVIRMLMK